MRTAVRDAALRGLRGKRSCSGPVPRSLPGTDGGPAGRRARRHDPLV